MHVARGCAWRVSGPFDHVARVVGVARDNHDRGRQTPPRDRKKELGSIPQVFLLTLASRLPYWSWERAHPRTPSCSNSVPSPTSPLFANPNTFKHFGDWVLTSPPRNSFLRSQSDSRNSVEARVESLEPKKISAGLLRSTTRNCTCELAFQSDRAATASAPTAFGRSHFRANRKLNRISPRVLSVHGSDVFVVSLILLSDGRKVTFAVQ